MRTTRIVDPAKWCEYQEEIWAAEAKFDRGEIDVAQVSDIVRVLRQLQRQAAA